MTVPGNPKSTNWRTRHIDVLLGQRIQDLRADRGMSRADLARALRVSQPAMQHIEDGDNRVSAAQLWQICGVLGVNAETVFHGLPNRIWRDRTEYERASERGPGPGVAEADTAFEPPPPSKEVLKLAREARGLSPDKLAVLIAVARGLRG